MEHIVKPPVEIEGGTHQCDQEVTMATYFDPPEHCDNDADWVYDGGFYCSMHIAWNL